MFLKPGARSLHNIFTIGKISHKNFNKKHLTIKYKCGIINIASEKKISLILKII
jgi:hypothetical protein